MPKSANHWSAGTILACLLVAGPLPATEALKPHTAEYDVRISVLGGRLNTRLSATADGYEAVHTIVPTGMARLFAGGSIEETSVFAATDDGVLPQHYRSKDSLTSDKTDAVVDFDWDAGVMRGVVNQAEVEELLGELAHDRVSIQYQLMYDLKHGGASESYLLFDIDEFKVLNVSVIGEREIRVPAGRFNAIGVQHQAEGSSRVTTLWCVAALDYLPVMIEQHRKGKLRLRASLTDYMPLAAATAAQSREGD